MTRAPVQVGAYVQCREPNKIHEQDDDRLFSPGANDILRMDQAADASKTEQPVSIAGGCLCPISWFGWRTLPRWRLTPLPGADNVLQMDSADVRNTEQRNAGSSTGKCLWPMSWTGRTLAAW